MRYLVTGGAGFIGSNLALELEAKGHEVTVIDNFFAGTLDNLKGFKGTIIEADISKPFSVPDTYGAIFHIAAITDPRYPDDANLLRNNIDGFKRIIALAQLQNAKLVYASSSAVYGMSEGVQIEDQEPDLYCAYAKSKYLMDEMAKPLFNQMHIVGLRFFNVFGPREAHKGRPASMIYHLSEQMKAGKKPRLFKWGEQTRDHIYVKDIVKACILGLDSPSGIYNAGTGIQTSWKQLVGILNKVLGTSLEIEYFDNPYPAGKYQNSTQADMTRARRFLKFTPDYTVESGIKEYMQWMQHKQ